MNGNCFWCKLSDSLDESDFKEQIHDRARLIDPDNIHDWFSLAFGWALSRFTTSVEKAYAFAFHIRHHTDLG